MQETVMFKVDLSFIEFFEKAHIIMDAPLTGDALMMSSVDVNRIDIVSIWLLCVDAMEC